MRIPEKDTFAHQLFLSDFLREPVIRSAIRYLKLPEGSCGLDAGCGIGSHTLMLAEEIVPDGTVTGLDISSKFLTYAGEKAKEAGLAQRITFKQGDINKLPFGDNIFDWVWSADCAGYPIAGTAPPVTELARVIRPGGTLAILGWTSQQLLPGYLELEARLSAPCSMYIPYTAGKKPEAYFQRALGWFLDAGLVRTEAMTFVGNIQAPLHDDAKKAVKMFFEMLWGNVQSKVSPEDWAEYQRLCSMESADCILNLPDYYGFFTYTLFHGSVSA
ncbi:MAG: class I SAM-dependent methyltransferase [Candidatus Zixiibacteriota bacterium]|nr:MAG: class I SAM-dependent methyltransferase [candidate division Zixibacteria bacterium]